MSGPVKCPRCRLLYDDSLVTCPYCGTPKPKKQPGDGGGSERYEIRTPWIAVLLSLLFTGWGHWYLGRERDGLKYFGLSAGIAIIAGLLSVPSVSISGLSDLTLLILVIAGIALAAVAVLAARDAYRITEEINAGREAFVRISGFFWVPAGLYALILLVLMAIGATQVLGTLSITLARTAGYSGAAFTPVVTCAPPPPAQMAPLDTGTGDSLRNLMAPAADLPVNYARPLYWQMDDTDFSTAMRTLGALGGYRGTYVRVTGSSGTFWIGHAVVAFPDAAHARAMVDADAAKYAAIKSSPPVEPLTCPAIGDRCVAARQTVHGQGAGAEKQYLAISFSRGNIYELFWTVGPDPDFLLVRDLATQSAARIG